VWFCGDEHRDLHRPPLTGDDDDAGSHSSCYPYLVSNIDGIGRCLVAARNIEPGELVFKERPVAVGPLHDTPPVCLTCFQKVIEACYLWSSACSGLNQAFQIDGSFRCPRCDLPMCGQECCEGNLHLQAECALFGKMEGIKGPAIDSFQEEHPFYQCITPLRCLKLKELHPQRWRLLQVLH
jgi:hypothetical protein